MKPDINTLFDEWKAFYVSVEDSTLEEEDFESLCIGFCCARGLTTDEARNFYTNKCIPNNVF